MVLRHAGRHDLGVFDRDIVGGRRVVIGGPLVPVGRRGDHDLAPGDLLIEAPGAAEMDHLVRLEDCHHVLHRAHAGRRAHPRPVESEGFAVVLEAVHARHAVAHPQLSHLLAGIPFRHVFFDHVGEGEDHGVHRDGVLVFWRADLRGRSVVECIRDHDLVPPFWSSKTLWPFSDILSMRPSRMRQASPRSSSQPPSMNR